MKYATCMTPSEAGIQLLISDVDHDGEVTDFRFTNLADFVRDNSGEENADLRARVRALKNGQDINVGTGAAPWFRIERRDLWRVFPPGEDGELPGQRGRRYALAGAVGLFLISASLWPPSPAAAQQQHEEGWIIQMDASDDFIVGDAAAGVAGVVTMEAGASATSILIDAGKSTFTATFTEPDSTVACELEQGGLGCATPRPRSGGDWWWGDVVWITAAEWPSKPRQGSLWICARVRSGSVGKEKETPETGILGRSAYRPRIDLPEPHPEKDPQGST